MPFGEPSFRPQKYCAVGSGFPLVVFLLNIMLCQPLLALPMLRTWCAGGSVANGNGVYLYLPPVHPGAVSPTLVLGVVAVFVCDDVLCDDRPPVAR